MKMWASHIKYFIVLTAGILFMTCSWCSARTCRSSAISFQAEVFNIYNAIGDGIHHNVISIDGHDHNSHLSLSEKYKCQAYLKGGSDFIVRAVSGTYILSDTGVLHADAPSRPGYYQFLFRYTPF